jgi:hypothetical protein
MSLDGDSLRESRGNIVEALRKTVRPRSLRQVNTELYEGGDHCHRSM